MLQRSGSPHRGQASALCATHSAPEGIDEQLLMFQQASALGVTPSPLEERFPAPSQFFPAPSQSEKRAASPYRVFLPTREGTSVSFEEVPEKPASPERRVLQREGTPQHPDPESTCPPKLVDDSISVEEKQRMFEEASAMLRATPEERAPTPSQSRGNSNLALFYERCGMLQKAHDLHESGLRCNEMALGPDHPEVGSSCSNLAGVNWKLGRFEKCQEFYERSLHIQEKAYGRDHSEVRIVLNNLALVHEKLGSSEKAREFRERSNGITSDMILGC